MATYNIQIEDSEGNKYHPKPDLLTTKEQISANTAAGKSADALVVKELYNNLTSRLPGGVKLIVEGSGANVKYYAQLGADAASKKRLGKATLTLLGLDYTGGYACMVYSVNNILALDEFKLTARATGVYYQLTDNHSLATDWSTATTSGFNNQFTINVEVDILSICRSSTKKYFKIITYALLYGADHPFEISVC